MSIPIAALPKALQAYISPPSTNGGTATNHSTTAAPQRQLQSQHQQPSFPLLRTSFAPYGFGRPYVPAPAQHPSHPSSSSSSSPSPSSAISAHSPSSHPSSSAHPPKTPTPIAPGKTSTTSASASLSGTGASGASAAAAFKPSELPVPQNFGDALTILRNGPPPAIPPEWSLTFVPAHASVSGGAVGAAGSGAAGSGAVGSGAAGNAQRAEREEMQHEEEVAYRAPRSKRKCTAFRSPAPISTSTPTTSPSDRAPASPSPTSDSTTIYANPSHVHPMTSIPLHDATGKRTEAFSLTNDRYPGAPGTALFKAREQALKAVLAAKREMAKLAAKKAELEHLLGVGSVSHAMLGVAPGSGGAAAFEALSSGLDSPLGGGANGHAALVKEYTSALGKRQRKSASPYTSVPLLSVSSPTGVLAAVAAAAAAGGSSANAAGGTASSSSKRTKTSQHHQQHAQSDRASSEQPRGSSAADGDGFIGSHLPTRVRRPASRGSSPVPLTQQQQQQQQQNNGAASGSVGAGAGDGAGTEGAAGGDTLSTLLAVTSSTSTTGSTTHQRRGASSLSKEIKPLEGEEEEEGEGEGAGEVEVEGRKAEAANVPPEDAEAQVAVIGTGPTNAAAAAAASTTNGNGYDSDASTTSAAGRRSGGRKKGSGNSSRRVVEERSPLLKSDEQLPSITENETVEPQPMAV